MLEFLLGLGVIVGGSVVLVGILVGLGSLVLKLEWFREAFTCYEIDFFDRVMSGLIVITSIVVVGGLGVVMYIIGEGLIC